MWKRILDWAGSRPPWWSLLLATVLSVSVGYLLEVALIDGVKVLRGPNLALLILGVVAMAILAALWASRAAAGARRGCFVHAVTGPPSHLARATTEHTLLTSWAKDAWPFSPVLPLRPELGPDDVTATTGIAKTVLRQAAVSKALVPAITSVTILPAGPEHRLALLGAQLSRIDRVKIRLLADNTDDDKDPFLEFELPQEPTNKKRDLRGGQSAVLFLQGTKGDGNEDATAKVTPQDLGPEHLGADGLIARNPASYTAFLELVQTKLIDLAPEEVTIRSSTAASLTFGAALIAGRLGMAVKSQAWLGDHYGPHIQAETPTDGERENGPTDKGAGARWWWSLIATSTLLGITVPLFSASVALLLEWGVAESQGTTPLPCIDRRSSAIVVRVAESQGTTPLPWPALWIFAFASALVAVGAFHIRRSTIDAPKVLIQVGMDPSPARGKRIVAVARSTDPNTQSELITDAFCDAVSVLPTASEYEVSLDPLEFEDAQEVVCSAHHGLDKTLRGRRPVSLAWNGQQSTAGPRRGEWPRSGAQTGSTTVSPSSTDSR